MEQELEQLEERIGRLVQLAQRLADENADLRARLDAAGSANRELEQRITEARARVEAALSRLPADSAG